MAIRRNRHTPETFWNLVGKTTTESCWPIKLKSKGELGHTQLAYQGKRWGAHRLAWVLTYGDIPDHLYVLHRCDNGSCCNPNHLFLGTQKDNMDDMTSKGRRVSLRGKNSPLCKYSEEIVTYIRTCGIRGNILEKELNMPRSTIYKIRQGHGWKSIPTSSTLTCCQNGHEYKEGSFSIDPKTGYKKCKVCTLERKNKKRISILRNL